MKRLCAVVFLPCLAALSLAAAARQAPPAPSTETLAVAGLEQPVTIRVDRWGIAHIYAQNEHDLFFAQGYNVARDRLFQLETWRRQATGTVAEILGPRELNRDIGTRLFQFRGNLDQELSWYHPHGRAIVTAFVEGINAYIARTRRHPELLSPEFKMLGIAPQPWKPADVVSRFNGLLGNVRQELNIALAVRAIGAAKVKDLESFQPAGPDLKMDPAIDASLLSERILDLYDAFRKPIRFTAGELAAPYRGGAAAGALADLDRWSQWTTAPTIVDLGARRQTIGSNNWVVSGRMTPTGFPLMANDPHRVQEAPSLRYWVHLVAPGWDVIGGGEPALPGVSIGHNQYGAWGLTIFGGDEEDLYVYKTNPGNPLQYWYRGGWETMRVISTTIPVKGQAAVTVDLKYTRHGPVVYEDPAHHVAYAVRAAWMQTGAAPYLASLRIDQAQNWQQFRDACAYSRIPSENMVWAGRDGDIGWQAVGISPLRPNWSGLVPVPGDGRYEWDGFLPIKDLPHVLNPAKGYWNTSNNFLIPPGWPYREALHYTWADPFRSQEVQEFLGSGRRFTVADVEALQDDYLSVPARSLVPLLRGLSIADPAAAQAQQRLLHWNFVLAADSIAAGIYQKWQNHLQADLRQRLVPTAAQPYIGLVSLSKVIAWLHAPDGRFGADPIAGRDAVLRDALEEAVRELTAKLGPDMSKWTLGAYHHAVIFHPLSPALAPAPRARFDVGALPRGGDAYTVDATGNGDNQIAGGSFKIIADTGDWDDSVGLNNPGQSGDVRSPHYRDLYPLWARGQYFPIFYSLPEVESVTERVLRLTPPALPN